MTCASPAILVSRGARKGRSRPFAESLVEGRDEVEYGGLKVGRGASWAGARCGGLR